MPSANAASHPCRLAAYLRVAPLIALAGELPGQIAERESVQAALKRADGAKRETDAMCAARETVAGVKTAVTDRAGAARDGFVGAAQATSQRVGSATTNVRTAVVNRAVAAAAWGLLPLSSSTLARHDVAAAAAAAARGAMR